MISILKKTRICRKFSVLIIFLLSVSGLSANSSQDTTISIPLNVYKKIITESAGGINACKKEVKAIPPKVTDILSVEDKTIKTARFGTYIKVKVDKADSLVKYANLAVTPTGLTDSLILYMNGMPMTDISCVNYDLAQRSFTFFLNRNSESLNKLLPNFKNIYSAYPVKISIGFIHAPIQTETKSFTLKFFGKYFILLTIFSVAIFICFFVFLVKRTNILRISSDNSPFSLSQSQLAFWTLVVAISYLYIFAVTLEIPALNPNILILLGISIVTTGAARLIDDNKPEGQLKYTEAKGFFRDILSDNNGISIHRFQIVVWTMISGFIFVRAVIFDQKILVIDDQMLTLMGISSAAYLGLKIPENNGKK